MHFSWLSEKPPTPEATWADHSYYFRSNYYKVTVSERDHPERTHVYFNETIIPENQGLNGSDFMPLNFKSSFSIVTHQGKNTTNFNRAYNFSKRKYVIINSTFFS